MKRYAIFALKTLPVALIFVWLFYRASQDATFGQLLTQQKNWGMLLSAFGLSLIATVITMIRWQWLVRALGVELSLREALRLGFIGFVLNLSPMGIVGGDLVKGILLAKKSPQYKPACAVSVIVDRLIGLYVMFLIGLAAIFATGFVHNTSPAAIFGSRAIIWLSILSTAGIIFLMIPETAGGRRKRLIRKIPLAGKIFEKLFVAAALYRSRKGTLTASFLATVAVHTLFAASLWCIAVGLFCEAPTPGDHLVIYPIANCGSMIPLSAGPLEYFLDELYPLFDHHEACGKGYGLMVGVAYRIITILIAALGGIYCLVDRSEIRAALGEVNEEKTGKKE